MVDVIIKGFNEARREIDNAAKQARYAGAVAINETAKQVQGETVNTFLPGKFTLRSKGQPWQKPGGKMGFNIKFAKKDNLEGRLGSMADWLQSQEITGHKQKSKALAIPTLFWKSRQEMMVKAKKPAQILASTNRQIRRLGEQYASLEGQVSSLRSLEAQYSNTTGKRTNKGLRAVRKELQAQQKQIHKQRVLLAGRGLKTRLAAASSTTFQPFIQMVKGARGIWVRTGKARLPIRKLFSFRKEVTIDKKLGWIPWSLEKVSKVFDENYATAFRNAMLTAKK